MKNIESNHSAPKIKNTESLKSPEKLAKTRANVESLANLLSVLNFSEKKGVNPISILKTIFKKEN